MQRIAGAIRFGPIGVSLFVVLVTFTLTGEESRWQIGLLGLSGALALVGLIASVYGWPVVAYRHASYRLEDQSLTIRLGVVWRRVITVPRSRVQHTDVAQGPIERHYGLGTLIIHTAGTSHARVQLPGLDYETACRVRDHLLPGDGGDAV